MTTTILDDDVPPPDITVQLSVGDSVVEADGATLDHTISLVDDNGDAFVLAAGETITLSLSYADIDGVDGVEEADLSTQRTTITLTGDGESSSFALSNVVADDALAEGTEGYVVSIASVTGGTNSLGTVSVSETVNSAEGRIVDETNPPGSPEDPLDVAYTFAIFAVVEGAYVSANEIEETGGVGTYVVLAVDGSGNPLAAEDQPGGDVTVTVADGSATRTADYSTDATRTVTVGTTFTIDAVSDTEVEGDETFTLSLDDGTWTRDGEFEAVEYQGGVTTTILDDDTGPDFSGIGSWFFSGTADNGGISTITVNEDGNGASGNITELGVQFNTGNKDGGGSGGTEELPDGATIKLYIEIVADNLVDAELTFDAYKNGNKVEGHTAAIEEIDGVSYIVVTMYPTDAAKVNDLNFTLQIVATQDQVAGSGIMSIDISHATITLSDADGGGTYAFGDAIEDKDDVHIEYQDGDAPVAIDLDGDGIDYLPMDAGVVFTDEASGESVNTAWVGPEDGMLAIDADGSGTINQSKEYVFTEWSENADTDMEAIAEVFDTNQNGQLDAGDEAWDQFGVWQDADSDGVTDEGEFVPLSELGVDSIALTYNADSQTGTAANGDVTIHGQSTVTFNDGSTTIAEDTSFAIQAADVLSDEDELVLPGAESAGAVAQRAEGEAAPEANQPDLAMAEVDLMSNLLNDNGHDEPSGQ